MVGVKEEIEYTHRTATYMAMTKVCKISILRVATSLARVATARSVKYVCECAYGKSLI